MASTPVHVCVTGGSGFMGRHIIRRLLGDGRRVTVLDLAPLPADLEAAGVRLARGSIVEPADAAKAVTGVDAVIHLAAKVSDYGPRRSFELLNVEGTRTVLEAARDAGARRFVHMSSVAVFDYRRGYADADETTPTGGHEFPYGRTKLEAEGLVLGAEGVEGVVVRPGLVPYGPEDRLTVASLFDAVERGMPLLVSGGRALISTSYIDNLVAGVILCLEHPDAAGQAFHVCDDVKITWREWIEAIARALDVRPNLRSTPRWLAYPAAACLEGLWRLTLRERPPPLTRYRIRTASSDLHFSSGRAKRVLGYDPQVRLEEGIAASVAWYRSQKGASP